jgi:hypothetical protein
MYIRIAAVVFLHDPGFVASDVMTYMENIKVETN